MADRPTDPVADPAIDPRVESFLHAELAKAERDFSRSQATPVPRARARSGLLAALAVATTAVVLVVVVGGPRLMGVAATPPPSGPIGSGPSAPATVDPAATPDPETVVRFDGASLSADGMTLTLDFTGSKEYEPGNPCTNDYAGWTEMVDGMLHAAVVDITPPPTDPPAYECTAEGYGRTVSITLPEPFTGDRVVDLADGVTKFAREPADLVVLQGLTEAWSLQSSESVDSDGTPLWRQVYATSSATEGSGVGRLELTQGFGGAVGVSGGDTDAEVMVGGHPGVLYRTPWYGELVLVWMLGDYGLAIVANDADFTPDELVALAETAIVPPHSRPSAVPSGRPSPSPTPSSSPTLTPAATPGSPGLADLAARGLQGLVRHVLPVRRRPDAHPRLHRGRQVLARQPLLVQVHRVGGSRRRHAVCGGRRHHTTTRTGRDAGRLQRHRLRALRQGQACGPVHRGTSGGPRAVRPLPSRARRAG